MGSQKLLPLDLSIVSEEVIEILLLDSTAEPSLFDEIAKSNNHRPHILRHLLDHPHTPSDTKHFISQSLQTPVPPATTQATTTDAIHTEATEKRRTQSLLQKMQNLKVGERIQLALKGSREIRTILLRDSNKEVMLNVLENPKITESEIELIAKQRTSSEEIIRALSKKREWLKKYSIIHALVSNPKTPIAISLKYINNLRVKDLMVLEKDKNIPGPIRSAAKKFVSLKRKS
jgi:hypothetical protein